MTSLGHTSFSAVISQNIFVLFYVSLLGLSKYNYITISVIMYCNCIVSNDLAVICIGIIFTMYHMQIVLIINRINQTILIIIGYKYHQNSSSFHQNLSSKAP